MNSPAEKRTISMGEQRIELGQFKELGPREVIEGIVLGLANMRSETDFLPVHVAVERGATMSYSSDQEALESLVRTFTDPTAGASWRELYSDVIEEYQDQQKKVIEVLERIQNGVGKARHDLAPQLSKLLEGVAVVTLYGFRAGRLQPYSYPYMPNLQTACAYGLALLLDERPPRGDRRSFAERLRRCAYGADQQVEQPCGKWFLSYSTKDGGPLPKYCSRLCAARAVADTGAARVSKHRARKATKPVARKK